MSIWVCLNFGKIRNFNFFKKIKTFKENQKSIRIKFLEKLKFHKSQKFKKLEKSKKSRN
jgi:hypothetical protein